MFRVPTSFLIGYLTPFGVKLINVKLLVKCAFLRTPFLVVWRQTLHTAAAVAVVALATPTQYTKTKILAKPGCWIGFWVPRARGKVM